MPYEFEVDSASTESVNIDIIISHGSSLHELRLPVDSTIGDIKNTIAQKTGLDPKAQRLFLNGNEQKDEEELDMAGVRDKSKLLLVEDSASKEVNFEEMNKQLEMSKAFEAIAGIAEEVDKLAERVAALEVAVGDEIKVADKEFDMSTEFLMVQLLKLDGVQAEGETKHQRKAEVRRIQNLVDALDKMKERNSGPVTNKSS